MMEVFASVWATASATVLNTGTPATDLPSPPGVTPATTFVPYSTIWVVWNDPSRPVIPCTSSRVCLLTRMLTRAPRSYMRQALVVRGTTRTVLVYAVPG